MTTARLVAGRCLLVEMGGVEPPSRPASRASTTCVVGVLRAAQNPRRQGFRTVSRTDLCDRAPTDWVAAPFLGDARTRSRKGEDRTDALPRGLRLRQREQEAGSQLLGARFYEASGASARNVLTYKPVETKHPRT
jgi:hypothetical protein